MKKEKMMYLTPPEFVKLKLSEAIPVVIQDVKRFTKRGAILSTSTWAVGNNRGKLCSVCIGGAAVLGFYNGQLPDLIKKQTGSWSTPSAFSIFEIDGGKYKNIYSKIAYVFNEIRSKEYNAALKYWTKKQKHAPITATGGSIAATGGSIEVSHSFNNLHITTEYNAARKSKHIPAEIFHSLNRLSDKHQQISGVLDVAERKILYKQMKEFAAVLAKYGY